jgi:signal peptidase I
MNREGNNAMDQAAADGTGPGEAPEGHTMTVDGTAETSGVPEREPGVPGVRGQDVSDDWADVTGARWSEGDGAGGFGDGPDPGAGSGSGSGGEPPLPPSDAPARPKKTGLALVLAPFAVVWRFAFPKKPRPFLVELPFLLAIALVLAFLIKTFLVQAFVIPSGSMQNTLEINDRVLVNRFANWMGDQPARGDIVVFQDPGGWLDSEPQKPKNLIGKTLTAVGLLPEDNGDLIKRVIGVPGDHVSCAGSGSPVMVNGVALNEPYVYPGNAPSDSAFNVVVPAGHLWVMGDHRFVSEDSRPHNAAKPGSGFVPISNVVGIAVLKVWPPSHFGTLPLPATFEQSGLKALGATGAVPAASLALALPVTVVRRKRKLRKLDAED